MSVDPHKLAQTLDTVEALAAGAARGLGGPWRTAAWVISTGARVASQLAREGWSEPDIIARIGRVEPHEADRIDSWADGVIDKMPSDSDDVDTDPAKPKP